MVIETKGTFKKEKKGSTGVLWIPADLVKDSAFPLKPGSVKIKIEGKRLVVEQ